MRLVQFFFPLFLLFSFQIKASSLNPERSLKRRPSDLLAPHIKLAIKLVGEHTRDELEDMAPYIEGCCLSAERRSYFHAIKYYYTITQKYYRVKFTGPSADDEPLTNGMFMRGIGILHEQCERKDDKEDIVRALVLGIGVAAIVA